MDYPVWQIPFFGGGLLIAIIAIVHVFVAHFAVGGGLFLVLTEMKARKENSPIMLEYARKHTLFFLLLTMVFGSLTGVGIWFIIAMTNPTATLTLIHTYTFGWATEWVFFLGEIIALLVYYYYYKTMKPSDHLKVGWIYFLFGFGSMFMINGIIGSMLTPGDWVQTGDFWDGFWNPSFWPQLAYRSFMAFGIAGLFGFFTASRVKDAETRESLMRYNAKWTAIPLLLLVPCGYWYFKVLSPEIQGFILGGNREMVPYTYALVATVPGIIAIALLMAIRMPKFIKQFVAIILLVAGFAHIGAFEYIREAARRPYVITNHTYSNSVKVSEVDAVVKEGYLKSAKWILDKKITDENRVSIGEDIYMQQCMPCHSIDGPMNNIRPLTAKFSTFGLASQITGQGKLRKYMPPFAGNLEEATAVAAFVVETVHGGDKPRYEANVEEAKAPTKVIIPPFSKEQSEIVLLAWNNLGMHCISDSDKYWTLLPPANDIYVQVVRRGDIPEIITDGVKITYKVEDGFENPANHVEFWDHVEKLFGKSVPRNVGLAGKGMSGDMDLDEEKRMYHAELIPVVPYPDGGGFNPYPIFVIEARDEQTGKLLAITRTVAPTTTEMGCKNCHGGTWKKEGVAGFSPETSKDILAVHDRLNGTDLLAQAEAGNPKLCQSCHADPVLGTEGKPELLSFPAALHGWHANYLSGREEDACASCHPSDPEGPTQCLRGVHDEMGLTCVNCHGTMEDHALSLLKKEQEAGKKGAARLMKNIRPRAVENVEAINARTPWVQEPDCLNCHAGFEPPETMDAFNTWTEDASGLFRMRKDDMDALACEACHGSTHAIYPAKEDGGYGVNRDNIQAIQYMGKAQPMGKDGNCNVCHVDTEYTAEDSAHHVMGFR